MADARVAAENGRPRINRDVVLDVRVALVALAANEFSAVPAASGVERAEGDAVIQRDVISHGRRLADYHAGAMVNEEGFPDGRTGVDIDPRMAVAHFRHHARQIRNLE